MIRKYTQGYWQNWDNVVKHIAVIIENNDGIFPTKISLIKKGYSGLLDSIYRKHTWGKIINHFKLGMKKKCRWCNRVKNIEEFNVGKKTKYNTSKFICSVCEKDYQYDHKYRTIENFLRSLVNGVKGRCRARSIKFDINFDCINKLYIEQNGRCLLTGIKLELKKPKDNNSRPFPFSPSIDRIDSNKGYTKNNIRLICWSMNNSLNMYGEDVYRFVAIKYISKNKIDLDGKYIKEVLK